MSERGNNIASVRDRAVVLMRTGLATAAELARQLGTDRQRVQFWADQAGIDPVKARAAYIARLLNGRSSAR